MGKQRGESSAGSVGNKMNRTVDISFHGLPLLVTGNFAEGLPETNINPADADEFEITGLELFGKFHGWSLDLVSFLNHFHDEIHKLTLEAIDSAKELQK